MAEARRRRSDADRPPKPFWRTLSIRGGDGLELSGSGRLAALMRWLRGEECLAHQFVDPGREQVITDPMTVNWARFPLHEAMEAILAEEVLGSGVRVRPPQADLTALREMTQATALRKK